MRFIVKILRLSVFIFPVFLFASPRGIFAQNTSRDKIIEKEFDCIRDQQSQALSWDEVCYSLLDTNSAKKRQDIINRTLDNVSQMQSQHSSDSVNNRISADNSISSDDNSQYFDFTNKQPKNQEASKESAQSTVPESPSITLKKHQFEIGPEIFAYHYKEPSQTVDIKGAMYGFYGLYEFRPDKSSNIIDDVINVYKLDGRFSYGLVDYSSDPSGKSDNIDDYAFELKGAGGYDFFITPQTRVTPYAGLGFRYLYDGGSGTRTDLGFYGYDRVSHYLYTPLGFDFLHQLKNDWQFGANFEADILLWGRQDSYLSDVSKTLYPDIRNRQRRGFGLRGSFKIIKKTENFNFVFEPFIRYWHIKASDIAVAISNGNYVISGLEPDNNTTEAGLKFGVQY